MAETKVQTMKEIAQRWIEEGWQKGQTSVVDKLHARDFVDHDAAGRSPDRQGFKESIVQLYAGFPDLFAVIDQMVVDLTTSKVALRWTATGTHKGVFMGIPPTGKRITFKGIEIIRVENDHIVERWGEWNGIELLQQLGGLPS